MSDVTGGPAFPQHGWSTNPEVLQRMKDQGGMTLLDWLAGQALSGLSSSWYDRHKDDLETLEGSGPREIAQAAYAHADAMLAEKARREATGKYGLQVRDHSPDAGKMASLEEENAELVEALQRVLDCIIDTRGPNAFTAVADAKEILAKHQKRKKEASHE